MSGTPSIPQTTARPRRRFFAGLAALVVLGVLFVVPVCAAMMLCSMPCCHRDKSAALVASAMAGCATECAVASDEAKPVTIATVAPDSATPRVSPAVVTIVVTQQASRSFAPAERDTGPSHRGADASLQVLNSVFRI